MTNNQKIDHKKVAGKLLEEVDRIFAVESGMKTANFKRKAKKTYKQLVMSQINQAGLTQQQYDALSPQEQDRNFKAGEQRLNEKLPYAVRYVTENLKDIVSTKDGVDTGLAKLVGREDTKALFGDLESKEGQVVQDYSTWRLYDTIAQQGSRAIKDDEVKAGFVKSARDKLEKMYFEKYDKLHLISEEDAEAMAIISATADISKLGEDKVIRQGAEAQRDAIGDKYKGKIENQVAGIVANQLKKAFASSNPELEGTATRGISSYLLGRNLGERSYKEYFN